MLRAALTPAGRPSRGDVAVAVLLVVVAEVALLTTRFSTESGWREADLLGVLLTAVMTAPVALRRTLPVPAMAVAGAAALAAVAAGYGLTVGALVVWGLLGSTALHTHRGWSVAVGLAGAVGVSASVAVFSAEDRTALSLALAALVGALPPLVGDALRRQRELVEEVRRLQARELQAALDRERLRIARDVHDTVGHHLSAISLQARAGQLGGSAEALRTIADLSVRAVEDTRRTLGILRDAQDAGPTPGLEHLGDLVRTSALAGVQVALDVQGRPEELPGVVSTCGYRVAQEALTNTARHAGPARAAVAVRCDAERVTVTVTDDGRASGPAADPASAAGYGLAGMRERVQALGGTLSAAPLPGRGFRVHAELPR